MKREKVFAMSLLLIGLLGCTPWTITVSPNGKISELVKTSVASPCEQLATVWSTAFSNETNETRRAHIAELLQSLDAACMNPSDELWKKVYALISAIG